MLRGLGLDGVAKTTGASGLQVLVPLEEPLLQHLKGRDERNACSHERRELPAEWDEVLGLHLGLEETQFQLSIPK
ncbi:hypothetical protein, partial [Alicyclobacillus acidocaldarius]|uniref:hypothetical protein n=1 Tax=Alicyclobacillus acidocaldarius TaxID=405212 RepID=UPI003F53E980